MPNNTRHFDVIRDRQAWAQDTLIHWGNINSGSYNLEGLAQMRQQLCENFAELGGEFNLHTLPPQQQINHRGEQVAVPLGQAIRIRQRPDAPWQIFLGGHYDTVFAADHPFQQVTRIDTPQGPGLHGPGVADLKGGLLVMLLALRALEDSPWKEQIGWEILLNPDEEIGSPGSAPLLAEIAKRHHFGLVYEPCMPDGSLAGARKGSGNFTLVVHGRSAHAGREHALGRNAIAALAAAACALDALNGVYPELTINLAKLEGGGPNNVVPALAICRFNVRVADSHGQLWFEQQLQTILHDIGARDGIRIEYHGGFGRPAKIISPVNQQLFAAIADCGTHLGMELHWHATGGCCDGNNLAAAGLANVDTLGVRGGKIHSADEYMLLDSLLERAELSALFLCRLAAGELQLPRTSIRG